MARDHYPGQPPSLHLFGEVQILDPVNFLCGLSWLIRALTFEVDRDNAVPLGYPTGPRKDVQSHQDNTISELRLVMSDDTSDYHERIA